MIKLNHNNKYVKAMAHSVIMSYNTVVQKVTNQSVTYVGEGYMVITDRKGDLLQVWQLADCKDPIFKA